MGVAACAGVLAAVVVLDPGRNTSANRTLPTPPRSGATTTEALPFSTTISATDERARQRAEAVVRPLGGQFVNAMIHRTNFETAHTLLAPQFQTGSVNDWQSGRHLPLTFGKGSSLGGTIIAYSGPTEVGLVLSINRPGDPEGGAISGEGRLRRRLVIGLL